RDIHAVAKDVTILDYNIPYIDTDAKLDALLVRDRGITVGHAGLHLGRAAQRIDDAGKLDQEPVACRLDEPAVVRGDSRIDQFSPDSPEPGEGAAPVRPHQARIPCHVGGEDRGETAGRGHSPGQPALRRPSSI